MDNGLIDIDPLHRDAQLPRVGKARPTGKRRRCRDIGVASNDHRVLSAELHGTPNEQLPASSGHTSAHRRRSGEHHVVGSIDDQRAHNRSLSRHDGEYPGRKAGSLQ